MSSGPRVLAGRYRLEVPLGAGGMAEVLLGVDEVLGRRVAVKLLRSDQAHDPVLRERLLREARAAASFDHPNAVTVFDVGEDDGRPFIVMELVEGRTLADLVRDHGALDVDLALDIVDAVLAALSAAHDRGLVHRDIKPANVLLPDDGGRAKLADFGIAKALQDASAGLTATGLVVGTPRYLSPEQVAGEPASSRSDLYAVGVMCYELLAGRPPFDGEHALSVALAHQREVAPPLEAHRPGVPPHVAAAVARAMEKEPAARFADAAAMRGALRRPAEQSGAPVPAATTLALDRPVPVGGGRRPEGRAPAVLSILVALALLGTGWAFARSSDDVPSVPPLASTAEPAAPQEPASQEADGTVTRPEPLSDRGAQEVAEPEPSQVVDGPSTPQELLEALERDPDAAGEKGDDLAEKLADLLDEDAEDQPKKARELIREADKWVREGKLDEDVAATLAEVLAPLASEEEPRRGDPPPDRNARRAGG